MSHDAVRKPRRRGWVTFGLTSGLLGIVEVLILLLPVAKRHSDEYQLQLPASTKLVLGVSWIVFLFVCGWWSVVLLNLVVNWPRVSFVISRVSLVMAFVLAGAVVISITMPLIKLADGMSK